MIYKGMLRPEQFTRLFPGFGRPHLYHASRDGAFAFFHQYVSQLGSSSAESFHGSQW
ncbi:MAG: hypothetical protein CM1200mP41_12900 [Gammaproteobacteria bacterium]|nr:MAG: hypothetical protein CM1200mP41_12900 [Gammaproteobacteria bacterium]